MCHAGIVEASFYLAFGLGSTGNRVSFAALNTGITHWRHDRETAAAATGRSSHLTTPDTSPRRHPDRITHDAVSYLPAEPD